MASARQFDLHYRLRPILRDVAAARLERRGLALDSAARSSRSFWATSSSS